MTALPLTQSVDRMWMLIQGSYQDSQRGRSKRCCRPRAWTGDCLLTSMDPATNKCHLAQPKWKYVYCVWCNSHRKGMDGMSILSSENLNQKDKMSTGCRVFSVGMAWETWCHFWIRLFIDQSSIMIISPKWDQRAPSAECVHVNACSKTQSPDLTTIESGTTKKWW